MEKEAILNKIAQYDSIVIFGHIFPDGDCYGSELGLREALRLRYPQKKIYAVGSGFKKMVPLLGPLDEVDDEIIHNSLGIAVDFNTIERAEDSRIQNAKELVMIDHHLPSDHPIGSIQYVVTTKIATCEILAEWFMQEKWQLNSLAANALFLGITTDSGRFQFQPTTAKTFQTVAFLLEQGANPDPLYALLYETEEESLAIRGYLYSHYEKTKEGVIFVKLNENVLKKLGITAQKGVSMVNLLANIKGYPIWAFFSEERPDYIRVEIRSMKLSIQPICVAHQGGGHPLAAGCHASSWDEVDQIIDELNALLIKGEKE